MGSNKSRHGWKLHNLLLVPTSRLARVRRSDKIISRIIEDLIYGELCQLESVNSNHEHRYKQYIKKTYLKTASLIANSAEAVAVLTDQPAQVQQAAFNFGKYLGIAFQIQDDRLDFLADSAQLGKVKFPSRFLIGWLAQHRLLIG